MTRFRCFLLANLLAGSVLAANIPAEAAIPPAPLPAKGASANPAPRGSELFVVGIRDKGSVLLHSGVMAEPAIATEVGSFEDVSYVSGCDLSQQPPVATHALVSTGTTLRLQYSPLDDTRVLVSLNLVHRQRLDTPSAAHEGTACAPDSLVIGVKEFSRQVKLSPGQSVDLEGPDGIRLTLTRGLSEF